jgi:hypothetical protein
MPAYVAQRERWARQAQAWLPVGAITGEDVVQDVAVELLESGLGDKKAGWFYRSVQYRARWMRRNMVTQAKITERLPHRDQNVPWSVTDDLLDAWNDMTVVEREAFVLRAAGYTQQEIYRGLGWRHRNAVDEYKWRKKNGIQSPGDGRLANTVSRRKFHQRNGAVREGMATGPDDTERRRA